MVDAFTKAGVLVVGLNFPVVPQGDQTIRFQINAAHTRADIEAVLSILKQMLEDKLTLNGEQNPAWRQGSQSARLRDRRRQGVELNVYYI